MRSSTRYLIQTEIVGNPNAGTRWAHQDWPWKGLIVDVKLEHDHEGPFVHAMAYVGHKRLQCYICTCTKSMFWSADHLDCRSAGHP